VAINRGLKRNGRKGDNKKMIEEEWEKTGGGVNCRKNIIF